MNVVESTGYTFFLKNLGVQMNTLDEILQAAQKTAERLTGNDLRRVPGLLDIYVSLSRDVPQGYNEICVTNVGGRKFHIFRAVGAE